MPPGVGPDQAPIPPPPYRRTVAALHVDALTLVRGLQLLALCRVAVHLAHQQCPPPLPAAPGGAPRVYTEETLLLLALLRMLWRLSYRELQDWLVAWPALALACGLPLGPDGWPRVPSPAQQSKRLHAAGAPASETLFVLRVRAGLWMGLTRARDVIIDSAPILAWRRADLDAAIGHAPAHHPRPLLRDWRLHTLLCRGTGLPLLFHLSRQRPRCSLRPAAAGTGRPPVRAAPACHPFGWSAVETRVALIYAAVWVIALAAWQAGRPDLIRSPWLVLAHVWEGVEW